MIIDKNMFAIHYRNREEVEKGDLSDLIFSAH